MASFASGQDESKSALWLATRACNMELSCLLGTTCLVLQKIPWKPWNKSFIDQACLVKIAGYWPFSFFSGLWTLTASWSINTMDLDSVTQKKKELCQYPAIFTSHLVHNPYLFACFERNHDLRQSQGLNEWSECRNRPISGHGEPANSSATKTACCSSSFLNGLCVLLI